MDGLRLAAIAVVSAVLTATLVIGAGRAVLEQSPRDADTPSLPLTRTAAR
ncbi:MAG: hypothetical protein ACI9YM_001418 [Brevundimonas sp.]|jgi:hypothetical protein|nr:hypothetical protein [Brevundimonas sp.]MDI1280986.1 hypothetical protein [Brevundimonas sp.]|tara:strand:+ start:103 stop:252 length:150 start_codon:yes stop_codon:yes gene_type:complete